MLGAISGNRAVGIYTAATKINRIVLTLVTATGSVILPRLSYYAANRCRNDDFINLIYKSFEFILMLAIPAALGLCLISRQAILLLSGDKYLDAVLVMRIMNPIIVIVGISNIIGVQIFVPIGKEKWTLYSVLAGAITDFVLISLLIPRFGVFGAAIGSVVAETMVTATQLYLARKIINLFFLFRIFFKYLLTSSVIILPVVLCLTIIHDLSVGFCASVLLGGISYLLLLIFEKNIFVLNVINYCHNKFAGVRR